MILTLVVTHVDAMGEAVTARAQYADGQGFDPTLVRDSGCPIPVRPTVDGYPVLS